MPAVPWLVPTTWSWYHQVPAVPCEVSCDPRTVRGAANHNDVRDSPGGTNEPVSTVPSEVGVYFTPWTCNDTPSGRLGSPEPVAGSSRNARRVSAGMSLTNVTARHSPSTISSSGPGVVASPGARP